MLRFIKHHFDSIDNVEIYPIISLLLFFAVFITMLFYVSKIPKKKAFDGASLIIKKKGDAPRREHHLDDDSRHSNTHKIRGMTLVIM